MNPHYVDCVIPEDRILELSEADLVARYLRPMAVALLHQNATEGAPSPYGVLLRLSLRDAYPEELPEEEP